MQLDIIPRSFFGFPSQIPSIFDENEGENFFPSSGLTFSEDDTKIYVKAALKQLMK